MLGQHRTEWGGVTEHQVFGQVKKIAAAPRLCEPVKGRGRFCAMCNGLIGNQAVASVEVGIAGAGIDLCVTLWARMFAEGVLAVELSLFRSYEQC